ncbi:diguanylate cyclase [Dactylosporangium sp. CA-092794]|uniref:diguanylate cyclase n=1 Tax=Dactylosporangium sp. CA-092794 TaxID=3239929 RepID=UPI003D901BDE
MQDERPDLGQSITDPLTGAYSRALLVHRLTEELGRATRSGVGCSLFLFDVDYFKSINDSYGHQRGDEVLKQLVERVNGLVRSYDALFRYGGDEFVLLLPDTGKADAVRVALRLVDGVRGTPYPGEPPLTVSVSLGVASFPEDGADGDALMQCADRRNYLAKRRGRACAVADDVEGGEQAVSSRLLERDIPLSSVQELLNRLLARSSAALRVTGERGAGYTRFLAEVVKLGRLRGFQVVAADAGAPALPAGPTPVLVVADRGEGPRAAELVRALHAEQPDAVVGVVYGADGWADPGLDLDLPAVDDAELLPWSTAALRVWLRLHLQGEPSPHLIDWLASQCGGMPARVHKELDRLTARGGLVAAGTNGWTIAPEILQRQLKPRRRVPQPLTELVGRQQETAQVARLLTAGRLVTLTGPGGIGKTRLSLAVGSAVADSFADGVVFAPLAEATTREMVVQALAGAFQVAEVPYQPLMTTLAEEIAEQSVLLVVDNFEQVLDASPVISELLGAAPGLRVLVSSRERLSLYGERIFPVPPLPLPDPATLPAGPAAVAAALASSPALALFQVRALAATYDFSLTEQNLTATIELCQRLDGLPLAIELAAARSDTLSPAQMLAQLTDRLDVLDHGPRDLPGRQQTLRNAIGWSLSLLSPDALALFTALGAFTGGCRLDAAAHVYGGPPEDVRAMLTALVDKSLVQAEPDGEGEARYRMLETIRVYAAELLRADPRRPELEGRYTELYVAMADACGTRLTGPDQGAAMAQIAREYANLRASYTLLAEAGRAAEVATMALGLWRYWRNGDHLGEGRERLAVACSLATGLDALTRARLLHAAAVLAAAQDEHEAATALAGESLTEATGAGDRPAQAHACNALGIAALGAGDYEAADGYFHRCLETWQRLDDPLGMAMAHGNLTKVALRLGHVEAASEHAAHCLAFDRSVGNTRGIQIGLSCVGEIMLARRDVPGAREALQESLELSRRLGDAFGEAMALHHLGEAARLTGDEATAVALTYQGLVLRHQVGDREDLAVSLDTLGILGVAARPELAARLLGAAEALRDRHRLPVPAAIAEQRRSTRAALETALGGERLRAAIAIGKVLTLDLAIAEAADLGIAEAADLGIAEAGDLGGGGGAR